MLRERIGVASAELVQDLVDPSISVKRNVTVPLGNSREGCIPAGGGVSTTTG